MVPPFRVQYAVLPAHYSNKVHDESLVQTTNGEPLEGQFLNRDLIAAFAAACSSYVRWQKGKVPSNRMSLAG